VNSILQNYASYGFELSERPPNMPPSGSLFLFDRKQCRFFRKDGHTWRKKADGKSVNETHEKLKVSPDALFVAHMCILLHAHHL
jgi:hypothetical protein